MANKVVPLGSEDESWFIENMKRLREEQGLSQGELARRVNAVGWDGFHQTTISRIEKGERPVRLAEARGIATALGSFVTAMIQPMDDIVALQEIENAAQSVSEAADALGRAVEAHETFKSFLKHVLREADDEKLDENIPPNFAERLSAARANAAKALSMSYIDAIHKYFEERDEHEESMVHPANLFAEVAEAQKRGQRGVDPEEA